MADRKAGGYRLSAAEYLPNQPRASMHTVRAYRDALTMLFKFIASYRGQAVASLQFATSTPMQS